MENFKEDVLKYNFIQDLIYRSIVFILFHPYILLLTVIFIPRDMVLRAIIVIPIMIYILIHILSFYIYKIVKVGNLDLVRMLDKVIYDEVGTINTKILYYNNPLSGVSSIKCTRDGEISITIGTFERTSIRLLNDIRVVISILHEVRHLYQLVELGYRDFNKYAFNINNKPIKDNKYKYYTSILERDAYIYSYLNWWKYYMIQVEEDYEYGLE